MEITSLVLPALLYFTLLLPCLIILIMSCESLGRKLLLICWDRCRDEFSWQGDSEFSNDHLHGFTTTTTPMLSSSDKVESLLNGELTVTKYYKPPPEKENEIDNEKENVECVFCLCEIEGGVEIRELGCEHLFHRSCLDRWVEFGRVTCPLCRVPLASQNLRSEEEEEEEVVAIHHRGYLQLSGVMFMAYLHGACCWIR